MSARWFRICVAALTILFAGVLTTWALLTPGFRAPDEPQHLNSVLRLLDGGGWPAPGQAQVRDGVRVAVEEAGWVATESPLIRQESSALPRGQITGGTPFVNIPPGAPADRTVILDVPAFPPGTIPPAVDQMTQHPPAYYALGAALLGVLGGQDWRWDQQLLALRLFSAALVVGVVPLAAATTRRIGGSPSAAVLAGAAVVAVPQVGHIGASVSNDALLMLTGAGVAWCASWALTRAHSWALVLGSGVVLGLSLLSKGFMLAAIPVLAAAFVAGRAANPRAAVRWRNAFFALAAAFVVGGWWWGRNLLVHGKLQPNGLPPRTYLTGVPEPSLEHYRVIVTESLSDSFWGNFGWLEMPWPRLLSDVGTGVVALSVVLALVLHRTGRVPLAVLLSLPAFTLTVLLLNGWNSYTEVGYVAGMQGRYLFGALVPLAVAVGIGAAAGSALLPRLTRYLLRVLLALGSLAYGLYGLYFAFQGFYQPVGDSRVQALGRWEAWSLLDRVGLGAVLAVLGLSAVAAVLVLVVGLWRGADVQRAALDGEPRAESEQQVGHRQQDPGQ